MLSANEGSPQFLVPNLHTSCLASTLLFCIFYTRGNWKTLSWPWVAISNNRRLMSVSLFYPPKPGVFLLRLLCSQRLVARALSFSTRYFLLLYYYDCSINYVVFIKCLLGINFLSPPTKQRKASIKN